MPEFPDWMPVGISKLPVNKVGYPIPWFVHIDERGVPDFRIIRAHGLSTAVTQHLCWVCGELLVGMQAFLIGPMCAVNHTSAEPPSHLACARWSALACPFLANPEQVRRDRGIDKHRVAGQMIERNPGVTLVWQVRQRDWQMFSDGNGGVLFDIGEPRATEWYARRRAATREEVIHSIDTGIPLLRDMAEQEGPDAMAELDRLYGRALELVPV